MHPSVRRPPFDPTQLAPGIVHLGVGAFHRAHMAYYTQRAMGKTPEDTIAGDTTWGIRGVSFRSTAVRDRLRPQDFLYALVACDNEHEDIEIIGAVRDIVYAGDNPLVCPALIADRETRIVSMTITEKGYCHDPATGQLDENHPGVLLDLESPDKPVTAIGALAEGLRLRRDLKSGRLTLLSCDNLPANGSALARILRRYVELVDPSLLAWIDDAVSFPSCVLDRIVPATTEDDRTHIANTLGVRDESPVIAEAFSQWVLEDDFRAGRPAWEIAGVKMVSRADEFETMKLRLLNGPHSACAYLGYLAGFATIAQVVATKEFPRFLLRMMDEEIIPGLVVSAGMDVESYKLSVLDRFANPALAHETRQIAMDGSQKLPQRLLESVRSALEKSLPLDCLALSVAAWMRFVTGTNENGESIEVSDPLAPKLLDVGQAGAGDATQLVEGYLGLDEIFGSDLRQSDRFKVAATAALATLYEKGTLRTVTHYAER
ncbi:MAG: mannitol dehydrogenase family protein [Gemmatimonadota bacterium]|nr:mannitol dehydrogenase family protein [Gemmatimonadota bacterium]